MEAQRQNVRINLVPIIQPTNVDKHWRIRTVLNPLLNHGRLFLLPNQHDLHREVLLSQTSVDLVDALASACAMIPKPRRIADEAAELAESSANQGVAPTSSRSRWLKSRPTCWWCKRTSLTQIPPWVSLPTLFGGGLPMSDKATDSTAPAPSKRIQTSSLRRAVVQKRTTAASRRRPDSRSGNQRKDGVMLMVTANNSHAFQRNTEKGRR